jgi:hypothetical protein
MKQIYKRRGKMNKRRVLMDKRLSNMTQLFNNGKKTASTVNITFTIEAV